MTTVFFISWRLDYEVVKC